MKRFIAILTVLFLSVPVWAQDTVLIKKRCSTASNEVGYRGDAGDTSGDPKTGDAFYCYLYTPDCAGPLNTAYIKHDVAATDYVKVAIYEDDGDAGPDSGDVLRDYTAAIEGTAANQWVSGAMTNNYVVTTDKTYWLCLNPDPATDWSSEYGAGNSKYKGVADSYANLSSITTLNYTSWGDSVKKWAVYITIGP